MLENSQRSEAIRKIINMVKTIKDLGDFVDYNKLLAITMQRENVSERTAKEYIKASGVKSPTELKQLNREPKKTKFEQNTKLT